MNRQRRLLTLGCIAWFGSAGMPLPSVAHEGPAHGNHDPHHGGVVLMYGMDLHLEIVLLPAGDIRIYFSDGQRADLPASAASDLVIEIERTGGKPETVPMTIGATGECWAGRSAPIKDAEAILHLAFLFQGNPIVLSFAAASLLTGNKTAGAGGAARGRTGGVVAL
jgi:hypothetical protein